MINNHSIEKKLISYLIISLTNFITFFLLSLYEIRLIITHISNIYILYQHFYLNELDLTHLLLGIILDVLIIFVQKLPFISYAIYYLILHMTFMRATYDSIFQNHSLVVLYKPISTF